MCLHPVTISNPYYGHRFAPSDPRSFHDCTSQFLYVPCGHCSQCISVKQMYAVQRVQCESMENHLFFATLTYNNRSLPHLAVSTGYSIPYADMRDLALAFKRIRKDNLFSRPFKYFAVSERGSEFGRPHLHCIISLPKYESDSYLDVLNLESLLFDTLLHEWRRNYGSTRSPDYRPLCDYVRRFRAGKLSTNYDLHYIQPYLFDSGVASVAFYVLKYMLKPSTKETRLQQALHLNLPSDEYDDVWPIVKSRNVKSHGFGLNASALCHVSISVEEGIRNMMYDFPVFFNPDSGQTFPLAPYYRNKFFSFDQASRMYSHIKDSKNGDLYRPSDLLSPDQLSKAYSDYARVLDKTRLDYLDSISQIE